MLDRGREDIPGAVFHRIVTARDYIILSSVPFFIYEPSVIFFIIVDTRYYISKEQEKEIKRMGKKRMEER